MKSGGFGKGRMSRGGNTWRNKRVGDRSVGIPEETHQSSDIRA